MQHISKTTHSNMRQKEYCLWLKELGFFINNFGLNTPLYERWGESPLLSIKVFLQIVLKAPDGSGRSRCRCRSKVPMFG